MPRGFDRLGAEKERDCILGNIFDLRDIATLQSWISLSHCLNSQRTWELCATDRMLARGQPVCGNGHNPLRYSAIVDTKLFVFIRATLALAILNALDCWLRPQFPLNSFCYEGLLSLIETATTGGPDPWQKDWGPFALDKAMAPLKPSEQRCGQRRCVTLRALLPPRLLLWRGCRKRYKKNKSNPGQRKKIFLHAPPQRGRLLRGQSSPRTCKLVGGDKVFDDGGGLCSPGRWPHDARELADGDNWTWLREALLRTVADYAGGVREGGNSYGLGSQRWLQACERCHFAGQGDTNLDGAHTCSRLGHRELATTEADQSYPANC